MEICIYDREDSLGRFKTCISVTGGKGDTPLEVAWAYDQVKKELERRKHDTNTRRGISTTKD